MTVSVFKGSNPLASSRLAFLLVLAAMSSAQGQSPAPALKEVVVTATRVAQALTDSLADVSLVDRSQIERSGASGLADLLARLPGVEYQRNGGPGTTTGVFLRGAESRFTAVYIDGVRIDSQATGGASWEGIALAQIERIEVLRGPAAAVYGSDALAGVVQIFTRRGEAGFAPFAAVAVGSPGTRKFEAGLSGAEGRFDYALSLGDERSEGFNARPAATQNPDLDGYQSRSASLKLGWQMSAMQRLDMSYLGNDLNSQFDSGLGTDDRNLRLLQALGVAWQAQWTNAWSTRLSLSHSRDRYESVPWPYLTITDLQSALLHNELRQGEHLFTADLERKQDELENAPLKQSRAQDGVALGYGFNNRTHALQLNLRHDQDSEFGAQNTASAAYGYSFAEHWRATASAATAFRSPTLYQRFSEYGIASLVPETAINSELGLRYVDNGRSFSALLYRNRVSNLITFAAPGPCASPYGCYANTALARYQGLTLSATQQLAGVKLSASADFQDPRDLGADKQLARRAKRHAMFNADTQLGGWQLGAGLQLSGERFDTAANTKILPGYALLSLNASTAFARDWSLMARADNLLDQRYELASGYATPGRSLYLGLKWAPQ